MNLNTVNEFRHAVYRCFKQAGDALFNTVDALSSETAAHSFPELSLSPLFQRRWSSLYEAFEDGQIDAEQLRQVHAQVQFAANVHQSGQQSCPVRDRVDGPRAGHFE